MTQFEQEISQQPQVLSTILQDTAVEELAKILLKKDLQLMLSLARGSSDNAVTFFVYLAGKYLSLPVASLPPSLFSVYKGKLSLLNALVVAVSQSGESSDVIKGVETLESVGALTLAITNNSESSLAKAADFTLLQQAGREQAVAASKTFSSQMMLLARLVAELSQDEELKNALQLVPETMQNLLSSQSTIERSALRLTHARGAYILGRGLSYGPALEMALKLKETSYLHAEAYSSAEFQHGPIAVVDPTDPIILLALDDGTLESNLIVAKKLKELGADLTIVSSNKELLALADAAIELPSVPAETQAFLFVLVAQLLALHLTLSKRLDPDAPRHLNKVTKTL